MEQDFGGTCWGQQVPIYGIEKGKRNIWQETPCEAYPEVQDNWIDSSANVL